MNKFGLYGKITAKEGQRDTLVSILLEAAESMQNLDDCQLYLVNISNDEPNAVFVYEIWSNQNAHEASLALESTKLLIKRARPIIERMDTISTLQLMGGKGTI